MTPQHVAIIGFGAIAQDLIKILSRPQDGAPGKLSILVRTGKEQQTLDAATKITSNTRIKITAHTDLDQLLETAPDVVVECAGHSAVQDYGPRILNNGTDLIVASVGAFSSQSLKDQLTTAAKSANAQILVPAGAIGGIDTLAAARLSGLTSVTYTGRKSPKAWLGTPAEDAVDLTSLKTETIFFQGTARQAAQSYPKNANVAATLALAGLGMDDTQVRLIADPNVTTNTHEYTVQSSAVDYSMSLTGKPSPLNPKTSQSTVFSIARTVLNRTQAIVI